MLSDTFFAVLPKDLLKELTHYYHQASSEDCHQHIRLAGLARQKLADESIVWSDGTKTEPAMITFNDNAELPIITFDSERGIFIRSHPHINLVRYNGGNYEFVKQLAGPSPADFYTIPTRKEYLEMLAQRNEHDAKAKLLILKDTYAQLCKEWRVPADLVTDELYERQLYPQDKGSRQIWVDSAISWA